jgi:lantibiotic biosynthesis protein
MTHQNSAFLEAADRIGSRVCRDAIFANDCCNWIGSSMETVDGVWATIQRALGGDLYGGTSGIALFLAHLAAHSGDIVHRRTARAAVAHARRSIEQFPPRTQIGFYSGTVGLAYALTDIDQLLPGEGLSELSLTILRSLPVTLDESTELDIISGCAGAILGILAMRKRLPEAFLLDLAVRLGDLLIARARRRDGAWSWRTVNMPTIDDLCGFSHGAGGIALSLLELWAVTKEPRFLEAADAGFAYERLLFSKEHENWPDLRIMDQLPRETQRAPVYGVMWCHGAPGIGLSRLRALELTGDERYRREADAALRTTARGLLTLANYSLCHGIFGNAELLLVAAEMLGDAPLRELAEATALAAAEQYPSAEYWPCGVRNGGETPNLMLGLAGIGYHYLQLYNAHSNPSVLCIW